MPSHDIHLILRNAYTKNHSEVPLKKPTTKSPKKKDDPCRIYVIRLNKVHSQKAKL